MVNYLRKETQKIICNKIICISICKCSYTSTKDILNSRMLASICRITMN